MVVTAGREVLDRRAKKIMTASTLSVPITSATAEIPPMDRPARDMKNAPVITATVVIVIIVESDTDAAGRVQLVPFVCPMVTALVDVADQALRLMVNV